MYLFLNISYQTGLFFLLLFLPDALEQDFLVIRNNHLLSRADILMNI